MQITLKAARTNKGMTQMQVAEYLGVSYGSYQRFEANPGRVYLYRAKALAELFGIKLEDISLGDSYSHAETRAKKAL